MVSRLAIINTQERQAKSSFPPRPKPLEEEEEEEESHMVLIPLLPLTSC